MKINFKSHRKTRIPNKMKAQINESNILTKNLIRAKKTSFLGTTTTLLERKGLSSSDLSHPRSFLLAVTTASNLKNMSIATVTVR